MLTAIALRRMCFNPLPTRRSGDARSGQSSHQVAFQSAPDPEVGRCEWADVALIDAVSIRSRPGGREMPYIARPNATDCFNPLPTRRSGDAMTQLDCSEHVVSIRSRPGGREMLPIRRRPLIVHVSIRSRPGGREMHAGSRRTRSVVVSIRSRPGGREMQPLRANDSNVNCFNPLPTRRSGDASGQPSSVHVTCFNPLPTRRSGDAAESACGRWRVCFNPLPTRRSGDAV